LPQSFVTLKRWQMATAERFRQLHAKKPMRALLPALQFGRRDCLGIDIQCGSQRGMPQQFLHDFEFSAHTSQQRRIGMTKCMPANAFLDSDLLGNGSNVFS
jgi:hypothetical protein